MVERPHDAIETFQAAGDSFPPDVTTAARAKHHDASHQRNALEPHHRILRELAENCGCPSAGICPPVLCEIIHKAPETQFPQMQNWPLRTAKAEIG